MTITPEYLAQRFAELDDAVLLARVRDDSLTEDARTVALAELRTRGLSVPADSAPGHDVMADDGDADAEASDSLTRLATYDFPTDAHLLRARLEAEGIPAWIVGADSAQAFGYLRAAVGGARVMVPTRLLDDARAVLAALAAGDYALDEDADGVDTQAHDDAETGNPP